MKFAKIVAASMIASSVFGAAAAEATPAPVNVLVVPTTRSFSAKKLHRLSAPISAQSHVSGLGIIIPAAGAFSTGVYLLIDSGKQRSPGA